MGQSIRLSVNKNWGTAFCFKDNEKIRFISAAHVLFACGIQKRAQSASIMMCDDLHQPNNFHLTNLYWDVGAANNDCDYVEFDCKFPGTPYSIRKNYNTTGSKIREQKFVTGRVGKSIDVLYLAPRFDQLIAQRLEISLHF